MWTIILQLLVGVPAVTLFMRAFASIFGDRMSKNKNISKSAKNGTLIHTRDKHLGSSHGYDKKDKKGLYRMATIVDSNTKEEIAVVKLTTSEKGTALPNYKNGKSKYKNYIETVDSNGNPIRITPVTADYKKSQKPRFEADKKNALSKQEVNKIKKDCINDPITGKENRKRLHNLKGRK
jgi:hypothetical protein